ncbi:MAG: single-stranded-DNA-specific exonuclease RecJ [Firmicutes bacterium]|nr:single-stranded-DNA-specific exonuclease RecJ [Bacillota bacterium]
MKAEKWFLRNKKADFLGNAKKFNIHPVIARLIRNRDIIEDEDIRMFLYGALEDLYSPYDMKNLELAADILLDAVENGEKIRVISDYDVDGCMSCVILVKSLRTVGAKVDFDIPDRISDGYGINERLVRKASEDGIDIILTCDNGIAAFKAANLANELGITLIVTDHHEIPFTEENGKIVYSMPDTDVIVDPKQEDETYPFRELCGAGISYKLAELLYEKTGHDKAEVYDFLQFAAIATVCDVVTLQSENRIIVKEGMKRLKTTKNIGLTALYEASAVNRDAIGVYHLGFIIGPTINAAGRLSTAREAVELFFEEDYAKALEMAKDLRDKNDERKKLTEEGLGKAVEIIESTSLKENPVIMVFLEDCHESVAGIIAGRLKEKYYKPVIVATESGNLIKCSGRSVEGYNMFAELSALKENFEHFGGHPMAAGVSFKPDKFKIIRHGLLERCTLTDDDLMEKVYIDVPLKMNDITQGLMKQLELMEPAGSGNPRPLFAEKEIRILGVKVFGKNRNVMKLKLKNPAGKVYDGVYFEKEEEMVSFFREKFGEEGANALMRGYPAEGTVDITYYPEVNEFRGNRYLQIVIKSMR